MIIAANKQHTVKLANKQAVGVHAAGKTAVKETSDGRFAVVGAVPRRDGTLRLIRLFTDSIHARRYNFAINGDSLGE